MCVQHHQEHAQLTRYSAAVAVDLLKGAGSCSRYVLLCMTPGSFTETELGEVKFPEISTPILEKVCQYFYYKLKYQNS